MTTKRCKPLSLVQSLAWIVGSALLVSGTARLGIRYYLENRLNPQLTTPSIIQTMIQTGPQKEALKTEYLAELLGISADRPPLANAFDLKSAEKKLLCSPLIAAAHVQLLKPSTLYVDYTIRQPVAWLADYENIALDKGGYLFPFRPFFSPKNLPEIYLGLGPFGKSVDGKPLAQWNTPLTGRYTELAFNLLNLLSTLKLQELFTLKRIDVSKAFAQSYGTREIVVILEDLIITRNEGKEIHRVSPKILRLSTKNYATELGNFLKLREQLVHNEKVGEQKEVIIDLRIPNLAFVNSEI